MSEVGRERDLVLNPNEYAYVLDKTKGIISCVVGSYKMSLSTSDALVVFNERTKRFEEATFREAITTFVSAPENWYIILKNPAKEEKHPVAGTANMLPELNIGKKVNIEGNVSFALYPGQMAKAIQGHRLHSNQYLLARVYDADILGTEEVEVTTEDGTTQKVTKPKYTIGQLIVIKGTEVPFYIPPTGIEVIPVSGIGEQYIRDAVTLERLEYCILKDEEGNKKYVHGAAVVFPEPDQEFVTNPNGGYKFKAIELSEISGIYIKVISDYTDNNGNEHITGEEMFITGKDQMIYYPRPEHAIINYNGKVVHHAIAIPMGEGRYILNRNTGEIKTVKGAAMYLPDPRTEVVVKRKLTRKQCQLWYPGNSDVLEHNKIINNDAEIRLDQMKNSRGMSLRYESSEDYRDESEIEETVIEGSGFSRGNEYSKPRTVVLDNKYEGVVGVDIWTGYAINVVSKNGSRKVIVGAQTYLMAYDETLEVLQLSTGKPKTTDDLLNTVYLRVDNNKISDIVNVQTKDFVDVSIKVSYCADFLHEHKDKWFSVENYVKYMTDRQRSLIKREAKKYNIEEFYEKASEIIRNTALALNENEDAKAKCKSVGRFFPENGMLVHDVEVLNIQIASDVERIINEHQREMIRQSLELSGANKEMSVAIKLAEVEKAKAELENESKMAKLKLDSEYETERLQSEQELDKLHSEAKFKEREAIEKLQPLMDAIQKAELEREKERNATEIDFKKQQAKLELEKYKAYADTVEKVMGTISTDLIASMTSRSNQELLSKLAEHMSPYALVSGDESVTEVTTRLLKNTPLEDLIKQLAVNKQE